MLDFYTENYKYYLKKMSHRVRYLQYISDKVFIYRICKYFYKTLRTRQTFSF